MDSPIFAIVRKPVEPIDDDGDLIIEPEHPRPYGAQSQLSRKVQAEVLILREPGKLPRGGLEYPIGRRASARSSPSAVLLQQGNFRLGARQAEPSVRSPFRSRYSLLANRSQLRCDFRFGDPLDPLSLARQAT